MASIFKICNLPMGCQTNKGRQRRLFKQDERQIVQSISQNSVQPTIAHFTSKRIQVDSGTTNVSNRTVRNCLNRNSYRYLRSRRKDCWPALTWKSEWSIVKLQRKWIWELNFGCSAFLFILTAKDLCTSKTLMTWQQYQEQENGEEVWNMDVWQKDLKRGSRMQTSWWLYHSSKELFSASSILDGSMEVSLPTLWKHFSLRFRKEYQS